MGIFRRIKEKKINKENNSRQAMINVDEDEGATRGFMDFGSINDTSSETEAIPVNVSSTDSIVILTDKSDKNIIYRASIKGRILIGKDAETCKIVIMGDKAVSRRHCIIEERGKGYFITDNNSTNGTYLNGERITKRVFLKVGDVVKIGRHEYVFTTK